MLSNPSSTDTIVEVRDASVTAIRKSSIIGIYYIYKIAIYYTISNDINAHAYIGTAYVATCSTNILLCCTQLI